MQAEKSMVKNQRYGRLVAGARAGKDGRNNVLWSFNCDCGHLYVTRATSVRNGFVVSCGCQRSEQARKNGAKSDGSATITHGKRHSPEYSNWAHMLQRCNNPNDAKYPDYGARGIKVCDRWRDFALFYEDMGERPTLRHSIDRIDNHGDYFKGNCRWATAGTQTRNRRSNILVTFGGREMILKDACGLAGIGYEKVRKRIVRGWSPDRALSG